MRTRLWVACVASTAVALAVGASNAGAATTITFTDPFAGTVTSCTGESVLVQGNAHFKFTFGATSKGTHIEAEMNTTDVKGVGLVTGARYVMSTQSTEVSHASFDPDGPAVGELEQTMLLNRLGETGTIVVGDDLWLRVNAHLTQNANGVPAVSRFDVNGGCR